jgi:hypothetical protein
MGFLCCALTRFGAVPSNLALSNFDIHMHTTLTVNDDLWRSASRHEQRWIVEVLTHHGLLTPGARIATDPAAPVREICEIDLRMRQLEMRHQCQAGDSACRRAHCQALAGSEGITAEQRRRFRNVLLQAYEMRMVACNERARRVWRIGA